MIFRCFKNYDFLLPFSSFYQRGHFLLFNDFSRNMVKHNHESPKKTYDIWAVQWFAGVPYIQFHKQCM